MDATISHVGVHGIPWMPQSPNFNQFSRNFNKFYLEFARISKKFPRNLSKISSYFLPFFQGCSSFNECFIVQDACRNNSSKLATSNTTPLWNIQLLSQRPCQCTYATPHCTQPRKPLQIPTKYRKKKLSPSGNAVADFVSFFIVP